MAIGQRVEVERTPDCERNPRPLPHLFQGADVHRSEDQEVKSWVISQEERTRTGSVWAEVGHRDAATDEGAVRMQYPDMHVDRLRAAGMFRVTEKTKAGLCFEVICREAK